MNIWLNSIGEHNILREHQSFTEFTRVSSSIDCLGPFEVIRRFRVYHFEIIN